MGKHRGLARASTEDRQERQAGSRLAVDGDPGTATGMRRSPGC